MMGAASATEKEGNRVKAGPAKTRPSFFEKKKQKTFISSVSRPFWHKCNDKKFQKQAFFWFPQGGRRLFFKKGPTPACGRPALNENATAT
jgi:hypothetical protein